MQTGQLWKKFSDHLRNYVRSKVLSEDKVDDILQDIFLRIHRGIDQLEHKDRVQSWIFGIARRAIADYYRAKERNREYKKIHKDKAIPVEDAESDNISSYEGDHDVHEEVLSWLIPMIEELPEKYRIAVRMADVEGKTQQEVADRLGLSLSGAKSRVQRGRQKLGEVLAECCRVEFGSEGRAVAFERRKNDNCCSDE